MNTTGHLLSGKLVKHNGHLAITSWKTRQKPGTANIIPCITIHSVIILIRLASVMHINVKTIPINDSNCSCYIKAVARTCLTNHIGAYYITSWHTLVNNSFVHGQTHTCKPTK